MGSIDVDPASNDTAQQWIQAKNYYTKENSGLDHPWVGKLWMNPPYLRTASNFFSKLWKEMDSGNVTEAIILVNSRTSSKWFHHLMDKCQAVCFPNKNIGFINELGIETTYNPLSQAFFYFGENKEHFAEVFNKIGKTVSLEIL